MAAKYPIQFEAPIEGQMTYEFMGLCSSCMATGEFSGKPCYACGGDGMAERWVDEKKLPNPVTRPNYNGVLHQDNWTFIK